MFDNGMWFLFDSHSKMNRRCGATMLIAAAVGVAFASRNRRYPSPPPKVPVVTAPVEVRVKAVERKSATVIHKRPTLFCQCLKEATRPN